MSRGHRASSGGPACSSPSTNTLGVVATPARMPPRKRALDRARRRLASVGVEARHVEPEPLRARPQVRVLETALVGEQRVVHRPERVLSAGRLGGAGGGVGARVARATGKWRNATRRSQLASRARAPRRTGTRSRRRRSPRAPSGRGRGRPGRPAAAARSRGAQEPSSASKMRFAPGRSPGECGLVAPAHAASGPIRTSARCGKPPGCSTPNAAHAAPLGSKSESCSIVDAELLAERLLRLVASQDTP